MTGAAPDPLDRQREILIRSLNDLPTQPNWAWEVLNTWDDLVEVARAARYAIPVLEWVEAHADDPHVRDEATGLLVKLDVLNKIGTT